MMRIDFHLVFSTILSFVLITLVYSLTNLQASVAQEGDQENNWDRSIDMPTPRTEVTSANIDEAIYVIGGFTSDGEITNIVEMYNVTSNSWKKKIASLPAPLHHTSATSHEGKIYVIGGYNGNWSPSNRLFVYDPVSNKWTEKSQMPTPRGSPNSNFVNGTLYVIGGDLLDHAITNVEKYDPVSNKWSIGLEPMPTARHHAASAVVDNNIYVIGGRITGDLINVDLIEKYDPAADIWITDLEPMPSKRSGVVATALNGFIYALGGEQIQGTFDNNERYDPFRNVWTEDVPMPTARHGLGISTYDGKIYAIGGGPHPGLTASPVNEIFQPNNNSDP